MPDLAFLARHPRLRMLLLPAAALLAFLLFVVLTFPYDALARRLEAEAQSAGAELSIGAMGPAGIGGLRAREVRLRLPSSSGTEQLPELKLERADLSPDLLGLLLRRTSFRFALVGYGGTARGSAALSNDPKTPGLTRLRLDARDVDLQALPLKELGGVNAVGKLQLNVDLSGLQPVETANGSVSFTLEGPEAGGKGASPAQGVVWELAPGGSIPISIPKVSLGRVEGGVAVEKGVARIEKTAAKGGDIDAELDGNVHLRPLLSLSQADLHVRFRPAERWLNEHVDIKGAMGLLQNAKQPDGSYAFSFTGPLSHLTPRAGR